MDRTSSFFELVPYGEDPSFFHSSRDGSSIQNRNKFVPGCGLSFFSARFPLPSLRSISLLTKVGRERRFLGQYLFFSSCSGRTPSPLTPLCLSTPSGRKCPPLSQHCANRAIFDAATGVFFAPYSSPHLCPGFPPPPIVIRRVVTPSKCRGPSLCLS